MGSKWVARLADVAGFLNVGSKGDISKFHCVNDTYCLVPLQSVLFAFWPSGWSDTTETGSGAHAMISELS